MQPKTREEIADEFVKRFADEFPFGYWEGVCECCTGLENKESELKAHFTKFIGPALDAYLLHAAEAAFPGRLCDARIVVTSKMADTLRMHDMAIDEYRANLLRMAGEKN